MIALPGFEQAWRTQAGAARIGLMPPLPVFARSLCPLESAHQRIEALLNREEPCLICRWGNNELRSSAEALAVALGLEESCSPHNLEKLHIMAGFYPPDPRRMPEFADLMLSRFAGADLVGVWNNNRNAPLEDLVVNSLAPQAELVPLAAIFPCQNARPWSRALRGRKVLVVHPFSASIEAQYARRGDLFLNPHTLPEFQLQVLPAVQSQGGQNARFPDWFAALAHMEAEVGDLDFEVALVAAGAYGLPLAAHIKSLGKKAVHMGGALQLLFGIMGRRWESAAFQKTLAGCRLEHFIRPAAAETPAGHGLVEDGCYW